MIEKDSKETKNKIIQVARILFADQGFEGTSIRDIAKAAEVNVASINYHFLNKERLFTEIIQQSYLECAQDIRSMASNPETHLEDLLINIFRYFTNKSHNLLPFFKMMMSSQHNHLAWHATEDHSFGPPGGKIITEFIQKESAKELKDEDLYWGLKVLFGHVTHMAIIYHCCLKKSELPFSDQSDIENSIKRLCKIVMLDLNGLKTSH
jgi:AcrR family transcriptional regulator